MFTTKRRPHLFDLLEGIYSPWQEVAFGFHPAGYFPELSRKRPVCEEGSLGVFLF